MCSPTWPPTYLDFGKLLQTLPQGSCLTGKEQHPFTGNLTKLASPEAFLKHSKALATPEPTTRTGEDQNVKKLPNHQGWHATSCF